jgi:hypothetical protein
MSTYIPLGKIPVSPEERQQLLGKRVEMEDHLAGLEITGVQREVIRFLTCQKGYRHEDIEINKSFNVEMSDKSFCVKADIVINVEGRRLYAIKCVMSSLESWERHSIAFCRVADTCRMPYAVITDGESARILDINTCELTAQGLDSIMSSEEAVRAVKEMTPCPYPPEKSEKEKRILYAFDAITCPTSTIVSE